MKKTFLITLILIMSYSLCFAVPGISPKKAVWDANTEEDLAGYYLYWSDSNDTATFNDTDRVDVGNVTEYPLDGITGKFLGLTAYDTSENESAYSNTTPLDNTAPSSNSTLKVEKQ